MKIILLLILQLITSFLVSKIIIKSKNELSQNSLWTSTKTHLAKEIMGAQEFVDSNVSTLNNYLDLSAWHGFQEIITHENVSPIRIAFDLFLDDSAYVNFIFNKTNNDFSGIRLSFSPFYRHSFFKARTDGKFLNQNEFDIPQDRFYKKKWHNITIEFSSNDVTLSIDNNFIKKFKTEIKTKQKIGFRGGLRRTLIDNIHIKTDSMEIFDSFSNNEGKFKYFLLILFIITMVNLVLFFIFRINFFNNHTYYYIITTNLVINTVFLLFFLLQHFFITKLYPIPISYFNKTIWFDLSKLKIISKKFTMPHNITHDFESSDERIVLPKIREKYSSISKSNSKKILFIGTSQTWGSGVFHETDTFPNRIEEYFNKDTKRNNNVICINTAIPGATSETLFNYYYSDWIKYNLDLVIINLSNNDKDSINFKKNLDVFIIKNKKAKIPMIFVLEANTIEWLRKKYRHLFDNHKIMREFANKHNIKLIDMHEYLKLQSNKGFLWWDTVHLTSYGHELIAQKLYKEIKKYYPRL